MDQKEILGYGYLYLYRERQEATKKYEKCFSMRKKDGMRKYTSIYEALLTLENAMHKAEEKKKEAHRIIGNVKH